MLRAILLAIAAPLIKLAVLVTAPVYYVVARTGLGADLCRRFGFQPIRLHYYQPVPRYESLPASTFDTARECPGYSIRPERIRETLALLARHGSEPDWPDAPAGEGRYHTGNENFGFSSAALLHAMIRAHGTRKVIEVGGGYSSLITLAALARNHGTDFDFVCVEPYPTPWLEQAIASTRGRATLLRSPVEGLDPAQLAQLQANDILFIDSSHCVRLASDVNFLYLQVIPRLAPGVIVHIHDIYLPYEYPAVHFHGRSKIFWNEQYLLQALLTDNPRLEVLIPGYMVQKDMETEFAAAFPAYAPARHRRTSSFWLRTLA